MEISKKKKKSEYDSTKIYSNNYNKKNINIQLDRDLITKLRTKLGNKPLKNFLEDYITEYLIN